MKTLKKIIAIALSIVMLVSLFACGKPKDKIDALIIGTMTTVERANRGEYNYDVLSGVMTQMALVSLDENGKPMPQLATFETKDSKTWTYTVRKGLKWHDGAEVTAEDVLYTLNYMDEHEGKSFFKTDKSIYESATLSDDKMTVTLVLNNSNIKDANNLSTVRILPKHIYNGKKPTEVTTENSRIGCGAYVFDELNTEAGTMTFKANEAYIDGNPNVERVIFKMFSNADTMYLALAHGDVDVLYTYSTGVTPIAIKTLAQSENVALQAITATNAPGVLVFNNKIAPFNDINLREAVKFAINYDKFKELFSSEYGRTPQEGFVPVGTIGYVETPMLKRDLARAKEFLSKSGYSDSDIVNGFHTKDGKKLSFTLTVNGSKESQVRYGELVKENLKDIGIDVIVEALESNAYSATNANKFSNGNPTHQASIMGYTAAGMGMISGLGTIYIDGTHVVQGGAQVFDENFETIRKNMASSKTLEEYNKYAKECQTYYAKNVPVISLFWDSSVQAYNKKLSGFVVDGNFGLLNYQTWFSIEKTK